MSYATTRDDYTDGNGEVWTRAEIMRDMAGYDAWSAMMAERESRRRAQARAWLARRDGVAPQDVSEEAVRRESQWLAAVERVKSTEGHLMMVLPRELRPRVQVWWTEITRLEHHWQHRPLTNVVHVLPSGLVDRGMGTDREVALQLLADGTGATVEQLRGLLLEENPALEPWMVDSHGRSWQKTYDERRRAAGLPTLAEVQAA